MSDESVKSRKRMWILGGLLLAGGVALVVVFWQQITGAIKVGPNGSNAPPARLKVDLATGKDVPPHTLVIPEDVRVSLGIRVRGKDVLADAVEPTATRPLTLSGSTMFDPAHLHRIRARFAPAKVVTVERIKVFRGNTYEERELRSGDEVKGGSLIAVFESIDVGMKKNDLIDALVNMRLDKQILDSADESPAIPLVMKLMFRQKVEADQNAINRARQGLELFEISKEDIDAVYKEADDIINTSSAGKRDNRKNPKWARVEVRAPEDGTIVEMNVTEKELVQDPNQSMLQIAKVDKMLIQVNAHEDELRDLMALKPDERRWKIRPYGLDAMDGIDGYIEEIGLLVDYNQHTIPLRGRIANPLVQKNSTERLLRGGQYVTASIALDAPKDVVEIPSNALADDGKQAIVFVQNPKDDSQFTMRRVNVAYRFANRVFVSSKLSTKEMELGQEEKDQGLLPKQELHVGERVITAGLLELKKELEDREADKGE